jgi:hypothetical protein
VGHQAEQKSVSGVSDDVWPTNVVGLFGVSANAAPRYPQPVESAMLAP